MLYTKRKIEPFFSFYSFFLNLADSEFLWILALKVLEVGLYSLHVGLYVTSRCNDMFALYELALKIESIQQDWNSCFQGYKVKTLFPVD